MASCVNEIFLFKVSLCTRVANVQEPGVNSGGVGWTVSRLEPARAAGMEALPELYAIFQGEVCGAAACSRPLQACCQRSAALALYFVVLGTA